MEAAAALKGFPVIETNDPQSFLEQNQHAFELLRAGLSVPIESPLSAYTRLQAIAAPKVSDFGPLTSLAHALQLKGRALEIKDPGAALQAYFDIIRLGQRVENGIVIHLQLGLSFEQMGLLNAARMAP